MTKNTSFLNWDNPGRAFIDKAHEDIRKRNDEHPTPRPSETGSTEFEP